MGLKLDTSKIYDKIEWPFLKTVSATMDLFDSELWLDCLFY